MCACEANCHDDRVDGCVITVYLKLILHHLRVRVTMVVFLMYHYENLMNKITF